MVKYAVKSIFQDAACTRSQSKLSSRCHPITLESLQSLGATPNSARLHTPATHPLQIRISISKVPSNDDLVLAAANDPTRIKLQFEHAVAAFAMVGEVVMGLCMSLSVSLGVG